jgi:hypothetical protein
LKVKYTIPFPLLIYDLLFEWFSPNLNGQLNKAKNSSKGTAVFAQQQTQQFCAVRSFRVENITSD